MAPGEGRRPPSLIPMAMRSIAITWPGLFHRDRSMSSGFPCRGRALRALRRAISLPASALSRSFARALVLSLPFGLLAACGGEPSGGPGGSGGPGAGGPPPVSVVAAVQRTVQPAETFSARLAAAESVEIRARVAGTLERVHFREGQRVARGDLLFTIDPRPFQAEVSRAEAQRAAARSQVELARSELARAEPLLALQGVSAQEIDQLRAAVRNGDATVQAAEAALQVAQLNLSYTRITAPIGGRTSRTLLTAGNLVGAGEPVLTTVVADERVHAWFDVSEAMALQLGAAATARREGLPVQMGLASDTGLPHAGRVDFIDNRLDPSSATLRMRAVFDNRDGRFTPGLTARVRLAAREAAPAVLVPERAIGTDQTNKLVLVVGDNNIVQPRPVQPGALLDGMRVVTGVQPGERVIVEGLLRAFPGAPVTPQLLPTDGNGLPLPPGAAPATPVPPAPAASRASGQ